jgi:hypothetical protein
MATRITIPRFVLLGGWQRSEEFREALAIKSAWATNDEQVLGAVYFMEKFGRFTYVLLVVDSSGRYRTFFTAVPLFTAREAELSIKADLELIESGGKPAPVVPPADWGVDLFEPDLAAEPNPKFVNLRDSRQTSATRKAVAEVARWFNDLDGNFAKDFQSTGFDARLWELYLFASFTELGFTIDRSRPVPDFRLSRGERNVFVEAVTANPSYGRQFDISGPPPAPPEDFAQYIENEMPQKFGSPLRSKVLKEYWNAPDVQAHRFLIALADFHAPASMTWSHTALSFYLYGVGVELREEHPNYKKTIEKQLGDHVVGDKVVPTNFFGQEAHKHISAVIFSNAGTVAKFNRMGVLAGFGDPRVKLMREGGLYDFAPGAVDAIQFKVDVEDPDYEEGWADELEIYHNPNAVVPLDPDLFPSLTHFYYRDGKLVWHGPERRILYSITHNQVIAEPVADDAVDARADGDATSQSADQK